MSSPQQPPVDDARTALATASAARTAVVTVATPPRLKDALFALTVGTTVAVWLRWPDPWVLPTLLVLIAAMIGLAVWDARSQRRRGRIVDERAVGHNFLRQAAITVPSMLIGMCLSHWPTPWLWAVGTGASIAAINYVILRWDRAYQTKRLARGDYGPYDLI